MTAQWPTLPGPSAERPEGWSDFPIDPRAVPNQGLRASDADRATASSILSTAFQQGRLDRGEFDQRLDQAQSARHLGELVPILDDVIARPAPPMAPAMMAPPGGLRGLISRLPRWWLSLALLFNVIWLLTSLGSGRLIYYWPMWPMLGTAMPMIMGMMFSGGSRHRNPHPPQRRNQLPPAPPSDLR